MTMSRAITMNATPAKATGGYDYPQPRSTAVSSVRPSTTASMHVKVKTSAQTSKPKKKGH